MNKESIIKQVGPLVAYSEIKREITKEEAAYFGLDKELLEFLNILARDQLKKQDEKHTDSQLDPYSFDR